MGGSSMLFCGGWMVLREKSVDPDGPCYVHLVGRMAGARASLLTLFGVDTTTVFEVYGDRIEYSRNALSGQYLERIPMARIGNLRSGYYKPVLLLVFAVASLLGGFVIGMIARFGGSPGMAIPWTLGGALLSAILFAGYFLRKTVYLKVVPAGAAAVTIAFRASGAAEQTLSPEEARRIIDIVTDLAVRSDPR